MQYKKKTNEKFNLIQSINLTAVSKFTLNLQVTQNFNPVNIKRKPS